MTVSSQTNNERFTGNGVTTVWDLPFRFFQNDEIFAYLVDPVALTTTLLIYGTDYTLTGAGLPEQFGTAPGKITTTIPIPNMKQLYVERLMQIEQLTDIVNQGRFFPEVHEDVFDRLTMLIQQDDANSRGAIRVAIGDPEPARLPAAPLRANLLMGFDAIGNPIAVAPSADSSVGLDLMLANEVLVTQGAAMIGRNIQVVNSIAQLRTLLKNTPSKTAFALGYYAPSDGGGGHYRVDPSDNTSADNGGTIIVGADGGRWKMAHTGTLSVLQFGADPTGVADSLPAFNAIRDVFQTNSYLRGGKIRVPKGNYKLSNTWTFTAYAAEVVHNITIEGDGIQCTTLTFNTAPAGTDGISFTGQGAQVKIGGLTLDGAKRRGVSITTCNQWELADTRIQNCGGAGFYTYDSWLGNLERVWAKNNNGGGFLFAGLHTSITAYRCFAQDNGAFPGWSLNGVTYSSLVSCASDLNDYGFAVSNCRGLVFSACGTESNRKDGWYLFSNNASQAGLPLEYIYIAGVELIGCVAYFNGTSAPGAYGNFITAAASDGNPIQFSMSGCGSARGNVIDFSVVIAAANGPITYRDDGAKHDGKYSFTGAPNLTADGLRESIVPSGSSTALVTTTGKNVTSITLPAGDWILDGTVLYTPQSTTQVLGFYSGVSTVSNTLPGDQDYMSSGVGYTRTPNAATFNLRSPSVRIRSEGTTIAYLVAYAAFSAGTLVASGKLTARKA